MRGQPVFRHTVKSLNTAQCTLVLLLSLQILAGQDLYGAELPNEEYPNLEYTYDVIQDHVERQLNDTFIAATFSGGGMRAAALAYGALTALRDTTIASSNRPLIDEVDYVSSVSGGSVTAAYWAINGSTPQFDEFGQLFLNNSVQRNFLGKLFEPPTLLKWVLTESSRTDELTEFFSGKVFNEVTYRELLQRTVDQDDRPYLVVNATDMNTRTLFPFIQLQFNLICNDLKNMEVATAVAASAAYPVIFPAIVLENRRAGRETCDQQNPDTAVEGSVTAHNNVLDDWTNKVVEETRQVADAEDLVSRLTVDKSNWSKEVELSGVKLQVATQAMHSAVDDSNALATRLRTERGRLHALGERYKYALESAHNARTTYDHTTGKDEIAIGKIERDIEVMKARRVELTTRLNDIQTERHDEDQDWLQKATERVRRLPEDIWNLGEDIYNSLLEKWDDVRSSDAGDDFVSVSPHLDRSDSNVRVDGRQDDDAGQLVAEKPDKAAPDLSELIGKAAEWAAMQQDLIPAIGRMGPHEPFAAVEESDVDSAPADLRNEIREIRGHVESTRREVNRSIEGIDDVLLTGELDSGDEENLAVIRSVLEELATYSNWQGDRVGSLEGDIASAEKAVTELTKVESGFPGDATDLERLRGEVAEARYHAGVASSIQYVGTYWADSIRRVRMHGVLEQEAVALNAELDDIDDQLKTNEELLERTRREAMERSDRLRSILNRADEFLRLTRADWLRVQGDHRRLEAEGSEQREKVERTQRGTVAAWQKLDLNVSNLGQVEKDLGDSEVKQEKAEKRKKVAEKAKASVGALHREYMGAVGKYRAQVSHYDNNRAKYVHVLDGGSADNIGFTPLLELLDSFFETKAVEGDKDISGWQARTRYVVAIVVDARAAWKETYSESPTAPGPIDSFMTTISTAIDGKSYLMTRELMEVTQNLKNEDVIDDRYVINVDFDTIEKDFGKDGSLSGCRYAYRRIPTAWNLSGNVIDALVRMGRALVLNSDEYRRFGTGLETRLQEEGMRVNMPAGVESIVDVCNEFEDALVEEFKEKPKTQDALHREGK